MSPRNLLWNGTIVFAVILFGSSACTNAGGLTAPEGPNASAHQSSPPVPHINAQQLPCPDCTGVPNGCDPSDPFNGPYDCDGGFCTCDIQYGCCYCTDQNCP
jgi:hypothetical protein